MEKYVVIKTHNFDPETEAVEFTDYRKATAYLHWMWEDYYNDMMVDDDDFEDDNISHLDEDECYHEETYAKVQWDDGDCTEFILAEITPQRKGFPENWEKYAM